MPAQAFYWCTRCFPVLLHQNISRHCLTPWYHLLLRLPAGFCELGISWQSLENEGMREVLGMPKALTGVFITKTEPLFNASRWERSRVMYHQQRRVAFCSWVLVLHM